MKYILLFTLLISIISFNLRASKQEYDSYVFALQWSNSICTVKSCGGRDSVIDKNTLTIHGLWPSMKSGKYLDTCTSGVNIVDNGNAFFFKLKKYWPSLQGPNSKFWTHEYNKHGYCMVQEYDWDGYEEYFDFVIDLYEEKYKNLFTEAFKGISKTTLNVTYTEMQSKIRKVIPNATFKMKCVSKHITELQFYLEKDDFSPSTDSRFSNECKSGKLVFK